ncbi:MAG TPA: RNA-binding protein [Candidatus Pacearchaeota archaeon]|nr:RNA-binding protein [Candidatus Pacearchaeota archaeon]
MSKRIYVGNLPWSVTKDKLDELFSSFGEIEESLVVVNKYTGRSRGFGFVTFKNDADADKALAEMNEKEVEGRNLSVREAKPMREESEEKPKEEEAEEKPKEEEKGSEEKPKEEQPKEETKEEA